MPDTQTRFAVLLFTDIVGSTDLKSQHGVPAFSAALRTHNGHFERIVGECRGIRILQNMGDGYFAEADSVAEAVKFALLFQEAMRAGPWGEVRLTTRVGIHAGEITEMNAAGGSGIVAPAADLAARVMTLAMDGQILLTRFPFDEARHFIREHPPVAGKTMPSLCWLAHGPYTMKGRDEPLDIFEVGAEGLAPLTAPPDGEKARRAIRPGEEETLGWRPAIGLEIPGRTGWHLTERLGAGGFGEVWVGEHATFHQRRAFKFCFDDERLRSLKREVTLVRLIRSALGERDDIVRIHELKLDAPPFYLESDLAPHGNLLQWAERKGGIDKIPLAQRIALVAHTAAALAAAHSIGVLHKDIKPTNILIFDGPGGEPRPRLVDFGIGKLADPAVLAQHGITDPTQTVSDIGHSSGTPTYSPPEYLAGKPFTIQGDIFGLGVLLYELVTAKPLEPLAHGWERDVADPLLRDDIAACVDGEPARRLASAADLAERLLTLDRRRAAIAEKERIAREAAAAETMRAAAAEARARWKHRRNFAAGLFLLAAFCTVLAWLGFRFFAAHGPSPVQITTDPPGAEVWRDGQLVGVTPFAEEHRARKEIAYTLKARGFEDSLCLNTLFPNRDLNIHVSLRPKGQVQPPFSLVDSMGRKRFGRLVQKENTVQFSRNGGPWTAAPLGMDLLAGDKIRTEELSRAVVSYPDGASLRLDELTTIVVQGDETSGSGSAVKGGSKLNVEKGGIFFFSREKESQEIKLRTPAANGVIRG